MKFRKRPLEVEAVQLTPKSADEIARWSGGRVDRYVKPSDYMDEYVTISIPTFDGELLVRPKEWVIKGTDGKFYACSAKYFDDNYEPVLADGGYLEADGISSL